MFFHFRQNNNNGRYLINDKLRVNVLIEAETTSHALDRAQDLGLAMYTVPSTDCRLGKGHCDYRWPILPYGHGGLERPTVWGLPVILVPSNEELIQWADTVIHYFPDPKKLKPFKLFGYGPDIFRNGIPVPPVVAKYLKLQGVTIGREITGGGWRMGYAQSNGPWSLAVPLDWSSHIFDQVKVQARPEGGVQFVAGVPV